MKTRTVITWLLTIIVAGTFLWAGITKISNPEEYADTWSKWGIGAAWVIIVGVLEILGAIGILIPQLAAIPSFCLALLMIIASVLCFSNGYTNPGWFSVLAFIVAASLFYFRKDELIFLKDI
jgi:uncharacterized membrane protein YphA (DoxX/SURF4 family)